jgi:uncharacterized protein
MTTILLQVLYFIRGSGDEQSIRVMGGAGKMKLSNRIREPGMCYCGRPGHILFLYILSIFAIILTYPAHAQPAHNAEDSKYQTKKRELNENTVVIIGGPTNGTYIKLAEDLQYTLDRRDTNELRILPVAGVAGVNNILDVLFLRNVDMCMTETDYFDYLRQEDPQLYNDVEKKIHYIAKLYNTEFHFVAKKDIKRLEDLRGKKISLYTPLSSSDISGRTLFRILGIDVEVVHDDQAAATEKLRKGEIAAMGRLTGAPTTSFNDIKPEDGMHFIPVSAEHISGGFSGPFGKLLKTFLPVRLKGEDYPNLIPAGETVPTVASSVVLAAYAWPENTPRYNRVAKFVYAFFDNFEKLKSDKRHPKWAQTNLAANVPGWIRFKAAQEWLDGKSRQGSDFVETASADPMAAAFEKFLLEYKKSGKETSESEIENLKRQFVKWRTEKGPADGGAAKPAR